MMSETEKAYRNMLGESNELRSPMSRKEKILHYWLGEDVTPEPPQSIEEALLLEIIEAGGGGGGGGEGSSLPTVTFTVTGMDSDGNPIFECDKTYQEAYRMCVDGNSCARMVVPNETDLYTTLVLIAGFGIRYAFHSYDTALALEFMDIYYFPDGEITFEHSHYDKVTDDTPVS